MVTWILVLVLGLWPGLSAAQYTFRTIDLPLAGVQKPVVTSLTAQGEPLGVYQDAHGLTHTFVEPCEGEVQVAPLLTTRSSAAGNRVGWYTAPSGRQTGFVLRDGTFTALEPPRDAAKRFPIFTEAMHSNAHSVVGSSRSADGILHAFRYDLATREFTIFDAPGATSTAGLAISADGRLLLHATVGGATQYVLWEFGTFTPLLLPDLGVVDLVAFHESRLVGNLLSDNTTKAVIIEEGRVELLMVPGSTLTQLFGLEGGVLVGRYDDGTGSHGFVARPADLPDPCDAQGERKSRKGR